MDHCLVGASSMARGEVAMRNEIGLQTLGFGTDYPHKEGTWPDTMAWINGAFTGVDISEQDTRMILGENAIRFYGLDRAPLQEAADRVGPRVQDVLVPDPSIDPELRDWLERREVGRATGWG
jgi:hypothetical protein